MRVSWFPVRNRTWREQVAVLAFDIQWKRGNEASQVFGIFAIGRLAQSGIMSIPGSTLQILFDRDRLSDVTVITCQ